MALTIGLDPGLSGGIAVLTSAGEIELLEALPVARDGKLAWIDPLALQGLVINVLHGRSAHAFIERVSARPGQGVTSMFTFGVGFGSLLAAIQTLRIGVELVTPGRWKSALGISSDKSESLQRARLLYPTADIERKCDSGKAEALLIAHWALRHRWLAKEAA